jgi:hypothetical protein
MPKTPSAFGYSPIISPSVVLSARTAVKILSVADNNTFINITSGTFTQTFTAASVLGNGWFCYIKNSGTGDITLDPNGSELIDSLTSYIMYSGETRLVQCTGTAFTTTVLSPFYKKFTSTGTFVKPPNYNCFQFQIWSGGASGGKTPLNSSANGGGGGAYCDLVIQTSLISASTTATIGAGGAAFTGNSISGTAGGYSYFGSLTPLNGGAPDYRGGTPLGNGLNYTATRPVEYQTSSGMVGVGTDTYFSKAGGTGSNNAGDCASTIYGGAGGGGIYLTFGTFAAGTSLLGGNGGAASTSSNGTAGTQPAGGGGATNDGAQSGKGGDGQIIIWGIA